MTDYAKARRHLMRRDPVMRKLIKKVGACRLDQVAPAEPFAALARSIASQQLSVKAAETIFERFCNLFPPDRQPTPHALLRLDEEQIRAVGFSRPKARFLRDLSERVADGRLDLAALQHHSDEKAVALLTAVKGIGPWTAEVFLMFRLGRPDVLPADDLGLMNAAQRAYGLRKRPTPDRLRKIGEAWRPYRSVAAWYLWASLSI